MKKAEPASDATGIEVGGAGNGGPSRPTRIDTTGHRRSWWPLAARTLAFAAVVAISLGVYQIRDHIAEFADFGYPGVFAVTLLANATVLLPAPGVAIVFAMGGVFNPALVALAAGAGGALGELTGYLAGFSGQVAVQHIAGYDRMLPRMRKHGGWAVLVLAALPNPLFDLAGIAAGITRMPLWRFLWFCWIGQTVKMTAIAFAGQLSISWLAGFLH